MTDREGPRSGTPRTPVGQKEIQTVKITPSLYFLLRNTEVPIFISLLTADAVTSTLMCS